MVFSYTILTPVLRPGWSGESGNLLGIRRAGVTQAQKPLKLRWRSRYCPKPGLGNCESDQASAKQNNAKNGQSEEAVRSEFFTHWASVPLSKEPGAQIETHGSHRKRRHQPDTAQQHDQCKRVRLGLSLRGFAR
jgi:hypothetical protein